MIYLAMTVLLDLASVLRAARQALASYLEILGPKMRGRSL